jgi:RNA polymerase sigma-70 factor, ECF subfamily
MTDAGALDRTLLEEQLGALRPELVGYCYRMLGSAFDADDAAQESLIRAWRGLGRFEGRSALRTWLLSIATNVCLDTLKDSRRRALPMDVVTGEASLGPARPRSAWVEPIPDRWVLRPDLDPARVAVERESIRLAFIAALQTLQPRQRAVLLLRDVLRLRTKEVAELLDLTPDAVNGLLRRARATMATARTDGPDRSAGLDSALLARYVDAFERFDIDALVGLLHEEATLSMPPYDLALRGPASIAAWFRSAGRACANARLVTVYANGLTAFAQYRQGAGQHRAFAVHVVETSGDRITALHTFLDTALFALFGLEPTLADGPAGSSEGCPGTPAASRRTAPTEGWGHTGTSS